MSELRSASRNPVAAYMILAIDPGPEESALVLWAGERVLRAMYLPNGAIFAELKHRASFDIDAGVSPCPLAIEKIASFGMPVGADVFETCVWTGRFMEAYGAEHVERITRIDVKMHLCHNSRAKDANIRQALIDRFGKPGTKKQPGPLYGISGDLWSALAVAVTASDRSKT